MADDPLTDVRALGAHVRNWRNLLKLGAEAADSQESANMIEARLRTGRPLADAEWIADMEERMRRKLGPAKRGPKPKRDRRGRDGAEV